MQRLHPPAEQGGEFGPFLERDDREAAVGEPALRSPAAQDLRAATDQGSGEPIEPLLLVSGKQSTTDP